MKIIHTSDWHLGRTLFDKQRDNELQQFTDWLLDYMVKDPVDALLIAGDIFHTTTPPHSSQEIYYQFLSRVSATRCCNNVVIIGGNHDSPSFLDAPKDILRFLKVYVIGDACDAPEDEVLLLKDASGKPGLVVCAVPFLRDRHVRRGQTGETSQDKEASLAAGIREHYRLVCDKALAVKASLPYPVPVVVMGHLYTAGGGVSAEEGEGVRNLYVGTAMQVSDDIFPAEVDYLALGHLHLAQKVAGKDNRRYSGTPIPMGFGESGQEKYILEVEFPSYSGGAHGSAGDMAVAVTTEHPLNNLTSRRTKPDATRLLPVVKQVPVPRFQELIRVEGDRQQIEDRIKSLINADTNAWLEVIYTGNELTTYLHADLLELVEQSKLTILRVSTQRTDSQAPRAAEVPVDELSEEDIFERILSTTADTYSEEEKEDLRCLYQEILHWLNTDDPNATSKGDN